MLALCVGAATLLYLWKRYVKGPGGEWNILDWAALIALLPFATSAVALVLQLLAAALFALFGALIGLILFLASTFGWVVSVIAFWRQVRETADRIDLVAGAVTDAGPPSPVKDSKS